MAKWVLAACSSLFIGLALIPRVHAGGVGVSEEPDSLGVSTDSSLVTSGAPDKTAFHLYKPRVDRAPKGFRDLEFLWSDTYKAFFRMPLDSLSGPEQINDMQRLAEEFCDKPGENPFGLFQTDIQLIYNFLAQSETYRGALYDPGADATVGFKVAESAYPDNERNHLDAYIYGRSFTGQGQWGSYRGDDPPTDPAEVRRNYGKHPSDFVSSAEDSSTGRAGTPLNFNSLSIPGPRPWEVADTGANRWTRQDGYGNSMLVHEGLHAINRDGTNNLHWFASGAEVLAGVSSDPPRFDVDYQYSLSPTSDSPGNAYHHWQSFVAWIASNWRGLQTAPTAWEDDLIARWGRGVRADRTLLGLAKRLRDSECPECATYPGFAGLDSLARVQRLIHDWRVANFVNSTTLVGGHYGFPAWLGFSPAVQLGAWRNTDGDPSNDAVSVPPVIMVGASAALRDQWLVERPGTAAHGPRPLSVPMYGAEYLVLRADPSLLASPRAVLVRVRPSPVVVERADCPPRSSVRRNGRLHVSIVRYSAWDDALHLHPEWATHVTTSTMPLDAAVEDVVLQVPDFGGATRAALVVVSVTDGEQGYFSELERFDWFNKALQGMPLQVGLRLAEIELASPTVTVAATADAESDADWSPDGTHVVFSRVDPDGRRRLYTRLADGTGPATPVTASSLGQREPSWSPRGGQIAYVEGDTAKKIWLAQLATGNTGALIGGTGELREPTWSPDGARLAYLRLVATISGELRDPPRDGVGVEGISDFRWAVRVRDVASGQDSLAYEFVLEPLPGPGALSALRWSADGRRLSFSRLDPVTQRHHLHTLDLPTRTLLQQDHHAPGAAARLFAPGNGALLTEERFGAKFLASCNILCGPSCPYPPTEAAQGTDSLRIQAIALRDTITGRVRSIVHDTGHSYTQPRYSPDGTRVAYTTDASGNPDVQVIAITSDRAPVMSAAVPTQVTLTSCDELSLSLAATDPDGDPVTYRAFGLPPGAVLANGHHIVWPSPIIGEHWLVTQALDPWGAVATRLVRVTVTDGGNCGGGGGEGDPGEILPDPGHAARLAERDRMIGTGPATPAVANSLLDGAAAGEATESVVRLMAARTDSAGGVRARLVGRRPGVFAVDRARLLVVDHAPGTVAVSTGSTVVIGRRVSAGTIAGAELPGLVSAGTVVTIEPGPGVDGVVLDAARAGSVDDAAAWGVRVEILTAGAWQAAGRLWPRTQSDEHALALAGGTAMRLVFDSDVLVRSLAGYSLAEAQAAAITEWPCAEASAEEGAARLAEADGAVVALARGEPVTLVFAGPAPVAGQERTRFLRLAASFTPEAAAQQQRSAGTASLARYALHATRPNPFAAGTQVRFDLPRSTSVRLEVYDAQGRRVRTLAHGVHEAGSHAVTWDGADGDGRAVRAGIYLVRLVADGFRAERRVVRLGD